LHLAMAQRLVRRLCEDCRKKIKPKPEIKEMILSEINKLPAAAKRDLKIPKPLALFSSQGCIKCNRTGFTGRIALFEVLSMTDSLADVILRDPSEVNIKKEAEKQGMVTMKQDGILKALAGITTIEEVLRVAEEK